MAKEKHQQAKRDNAKQINQTQVSKKAVVTQQKQSAGKQKAKLPVHWCRAQPTIPIAPKFTTNLCLHKQDPPKVKTKEKE